MAFSAKVKEESLVACGRHCSICHKFCGIKIECNHIIPEASGGLDSFENCIPLCFDCHADMGSYDINHPKGNKYSTSELKRHRDSWYAKVQNSGAMMASATYLELDRQTYKKTKELLPWESGLMDWIAHSSVEAIIPRLAIRQADLFNIACTNPAFEFVDADLEGIRVGLNNAILEFVDSLAKNTWPLTTDREFNQVATEWAYEQPDRFENLVADLNAKASVVLSNYVQLIKLGRRKLGID